MYTGTSVLELKSFWKTVQEGICSKTKSPLLPKGRVTGHTGISLKGLSGTESRPRIETRSFVRPPGRFFHEQCGRGPNCLGIKMSENRD